MEKIEFIKSYIDRCNDLLENKNTVCAEALIKNIVHIFANEIQNIVDGVDYYKSYLDKPNLLNDLELLKEKLVNYMLNISIENNRKGKDIELGRLNSLSITNSNVSNNANNNEAVAIALAKVEASFSGVIKQISEFPEQQLSSQQKEQLISLIEFVEVNKNTNDKKTKSEKIMKVVNFIADKGMDLFIALAPYLFKIASEV